MIIESARIVRELQGAYANVITYKERCDACGYIAPKNSFAFSMLPSEAPTASKALSALVALSTRW